MRSAALPAALLHLFALASALHLADRDSPTDGKDTLIIVRTHLPAPGMQERLLALARDVGENLTSAHFLVSVDDSRLDRRWAAPLPAAQVHRFVWEDVEARFPSVAWRNLTGTQGLASGRTFHMEPVILAVDFAKAQVKLRADAVVWVLEDDVLVCGAFSEIVRAYAGDDADLLTGNRHPAKAWLHREFGSEAFLQKYPLAARYQSPEFVERFSMRFLEHIERLNSEEAVAAQSEMFAPTVCANDGYVHKYFRPEHKGLWYCVTRVPQWAEASFCKGKTNMNHAAKYARVADLW